MSSSKNRPAMGRGVSALFKDKTTDINSIEDKNAEVIVGNIIEIDIETIEINPFQPRTNFNEDSLLELATSIKELGVIQPITVRKTEFNQFQLISGERRLRASKLAGLKTIPAYIRIANDNDSLIMALVENIQRTDLDPIEIALSYQRLIDEIQLTQEQMSEKVGKNRSTIANYLRLLKLDPMIQTGIRDEFISMGHGRAIISIDDLDVQLKIYNKIITDNLSVRETEALVKEYQEGKKEGKKSAIKPVEKAFELSDDSKNKLNRFFGNLVDVNISSKGNGKILIPFKNEKDLERILNLIQ
ncbi:MAG: ParB/RepB/Spo0J family partition protein [Flavobacterium sp.]|jgi:ParB family chromosome partitioning protein